jgi:hypothetical protein
MVALSAPYNSQTAFIVQQELILYILLLAATQQGRVCAK